MTVPLEGDRDPLTLARPNAALRRGHPERIKRSASLYFSKGACPLPRRSTGTEGAKKWWLLLAGHFFELPMFGQLGLDETQFWLLPFLFAAGRGLPFSLLPLICFLFHLSPPSVYKHRPISLIFTNWKGVRARLLQGTNKPL